MRCDHQVANQRGIAHVRSGDGLLPGAGRCVLRNAHPDDGAALESVASLPGSPRTGWLPAGRVMDRRRTRRRRGQGEVFALRGTTTLLQRAADRNPLENQEKGAHTAMSCGLRAENLLSI